MNQRDFSSRGCGAVERFVPGQAWVRKGLGFLLPCALLAASLTAESALAAGRVANMPSSPMTVIAVDTAPDDVWTWVDVPTAHCGNGSATGFAVNPHANAKNLMIYLKGGGLCTDQETCWGSSPTAANMSGYDGTTFATDGTVTLPMFQRNPTWPFAEATMVMVPYCTGDLHIGTGVANLPTPTYFEGGANLEQYMSQLHAAYPGIERVWITGSSAGGAGAMLNQYFANQAFGGVRVDVIDDSAPPVPNPYLGMPSIWSPKLPPNCPACAEGIVGFYQYDRATFPDSRFAIWTYTYDVVLPFYWGETLADFSVDLRETLFEVNKDPNAKTFLVRGAGHVVLGSPYINVQDHLLRWLKDAVDDNAQWHSQSVVPNPTR